MRLLIRQRKRILTLPGKRERYLSLLEIKGGGMVDGEMVQ
jgi:hypothetical protein